MKAIALISGGLDSVLAAKLIKGQGIEILPLNFKIPFCHRDKELTPDKQNNLKQAADNLGVDLRIVDISDDFLKMLESPEYGFGSNMNPCIDCKILMLAKAKGLMGELGAEFVITGEVLGQRPMSQHRQALEIIEKKSGLEGLVLRPLSAKLLTETIPEIRGWIDRNKLLKFSGRQRRPQMDLAKDLGIVKYPNASGGCLLTDPGFSQRMKDLVSHRGISIDNIELLKIGRHFRLSDEAKLVVGRNEKENEELALLAREGDYLFLPNEKLAGPTSLGRGKFSQELAQFACGITCRYCDLDAGEEAEIIYRKIPQKEDNRSKVAPVEDKELVVLRI